MSYHSIHCSKAWMLTGHSRKGHLIRKLRRLSAASSLLNCIGGGGRIIPSRFSVITKGRPSALGRFGTIMVSEPAPSRRTVELKETGKFTVSVPICEPERWRVAFYV